MLTLTPGSFLKSANQIEACDFCQVLAIVVRSMNQTVGHLCVLSASNVEVIVQIHMKRMIVLLHVYVQTLSHAHTPTE